MFSEFHRRLKRIRIICKSSLIGIVLFQFLFLTSAQVGKAESVVTISCGIGSDQTYTVSIPDGIARNGSRCEGELILDLRVKIIADTAFANSKLTSVVIPDSVVSIGNSAFKDSQVKSVILGESVYFIGEMAFENTKISSVIIPDSADNFGGWIFRGTPITTVQYCLFYVVGYGPDTYER